jgi:hypothetical protein
MKMFIRFSYHFGKGVRVTPFGLWLPVPFGLLFQS